MRRQEPKKTYPVVAGYVRGVCSRDKSVFGAYQDRYAYVGESYWAPFNGGCAKWLGDDPPPNARIILAAS